MATYIWAGDLPAVAQTETGEITLWNSDTLYIVTINGKTVSVGTALDAAIIDIDTAAAALVAALEASGIPEFAEIAWTNPGAPAALITATAAAAGKPYVISLTETGTGTVTDFSVSETTDQANQGPNTWAAGNFFDPAGARHTVLPGMTTANGTDSVIIRDSDVAILYDLDQSGITYSLASIEIRASFTAEIGLSVQDAGGGTGYNQYRQRYLFINCPVWSIGSGAGDGSSKIRIQADTSVVSDFVVYQTDESDDDFGTVEVDGNGIAFTLVTVKSGSVDFARDDATAGAFIDTLIADTGADVKVDENCTLATAVVEGGTLRTWVPVTTKITVDQQGTWNHFEGNVELIDLFSGVLNLLTIADLTIATLNSGARGVVVAQNASGTPTITTWNRTVAGNQGINDPNGIVAITNPINLGQTKMGDHSWDLGPNRTVAIA